MKSTIYYRDRTLLLDTTPLVVDFTELLKVFNRRLEN